MNKAQRRAAKRKARERQDRADRQRRRESDVCAKLLIQAGMAWEVDHDMDIANLAAGALVFGQVLGQNAFSVQMASVGLLTWGILTGWSLFLRRRR